MRYEYEIMCFVPLEMILNEVLLRYDMTLIFLPFTHSYDDFQIFKYISAERVNQPSR